MKLLGAVSQGSGAINEDACGFCGPEDDVSAAWVFDGVTGINERFLLGVPSEPAWFVGVANRHLAELAARPGGVLDVLRALVPRLEEEWHKALAGQVVPNGYDLPAACLTLVKKVDDQWQALRLGDSYILSHDGVAVTNHAFPPNDLPNLEAELRAQAHALRLSGDVDFAALREKFRARLMQSRTGRNMPGSYAILVPEQTSLNMPQVIDVGSPSEILLCTDGFYRIVDTYEMLDDEALIAACGAAGGVHALLRQMRDVERADPTCRRFPRFKAADDATALMLRAAS